MSIWFFSDPHLGVVRNSHTTVASRQRLRQKVFDTVARRVQGDGTPAICLGDLFDTSDNDEATILQGYNIVNRCKVVLAGNHDLPNREGKLSSVQLLAEIFPDRIVINDVGSYGCRAYLEGSKGAEVLIMAVPHCSSQALFEASLDEATNDARVDASLAEKAGRALSPRFLCLHCNYGSNFIQNDASLNLTRERAEQLLEVFDYVLLGHEHMPRRLHGGRLIILGNTHPTSFSDLSDKFVWEFNGSGFIPHETWSMDDGYRRINIAQGGIDVPESVEFVEVAGTAEPEDMPRIAQEIAQLWKTHPRLLAVRNAVECEALAPAQTSEIQRVMDLPTKVSEALAGDEKLRGLWLHYLGDVA